MAPKRIEKAPVASSSKSTKPRPEKKIELSSLEIIKWKSKTKRVNNTRILVETETEKLKDVKSSPRLSNPIGIGREIVSFLKAETSVNSLPLDESTMIANWDSIPDDPKKREMEAMFNKLYAMKLELCAFRIGFVAQVAETIFKPDYASSSSHNVPVVGVNTEPEENDFVNDVNNETCGIQNGGVCSVALEEEEATCVELLESTEREREEVSRKHIDLEDSQEVEMEENEADLVSCDAANIEINNDASVTLAEEMKEVSGHEIEMEENEADLVSCDVANIEINNDASVTVAEEVKEDSCVASGGIEEGSGSNPSSVSRKKLLVLDLNGLLANVVSAFPGCKGDTVIGRRAVFKRPFCDDFLKFCFEKFEIGVWSSRMQHNVERITDFLLGDMKSKLLFCWDMSYCVETRIGSLENIHKSVVFKELNQLWENRDSKLPWKKGDYNETNTVLIDDSPYKALLNPPYTAIFPHSYNHYNKTDASLGSNGDLRLHLEKLAEAENVQEFIKKNPFGQEAITEASESWEFYRGAIAQSRHLQKRHY